MAEIVGLVGVTLQFVEYGIKTTRKVRQIYKSESGASVRNGDIEADAKAIRVLAEEMQESKSRLDVSTSLSKAEEQLGELSISCDKVANKLIGILDEIKLKGSRGVWKALKQYALNESRTEEIKSLEKRLEDIRGVMLFHMVAISRDEQSKLIRPIKDLVATNERFQANTTENLEAIRSKLNEYLMPVPSTKKLDDLLKLPVSLRNDIMDTLLLQLKSLATESRVVQRQQSILGSLLFPSMRTRYAAIKDAHKQTFEWIFTSRDQLFPGWLRSGTGIFWIRGKAGSGKSTFMRFLVEHPSTRAWLESWADGQRIAINNHFFWNAGNSMQKSQLGLLQTLLYQIFRQCPHFIETFCPARWESSMHSTASEPWDVNELREALKALSQVDKLETKFCFFIDGLDEYTAGETRYDGSYVELISLLQQLSESPRIKICVSSRPWTQFEDAFGGLKTQLKLEALTSSDMKRFVQDELEGSRAFGRLSQRDQRYRILVNDIVKRSQGVFLWVHLVVRSLLRGLSAEDNFTELQDRLNAVPNDLCDYFGDILRKIEPVYWKQSVRIFWATIRAQQSLPILAFEFLDNESENPEYALELTNEAASELDYEEIHRRMTKRINARCKDLLDITADPQEDNRLMRYRVDFLHRTVRDFFIDTNILSEVMRERNTDHLDSLLSLCRMMVALLKTYHAQTQTEKKTPNLVFSLTDSLMHYAWRMEAESIGGVQSPETADTKIRLGKMFKLLDELDRVNSAGFAEGRHWTNVRDIPKPREHYKEYGQCTFLAAAAQAKLVLYVRKRLDDDPGLLLRKRGRPLLDYALRPKLVTSLHLLDTTQGPTEGPDEPVVTILLEKGADPNQKVRIYDGLTTWELFLRTCIGHNTAGFEVPADDIHQVMWSMLSHGADPNVHVKVRDDQDVVDIPTILNRCGMQSHQINELQHLVDMKRPGISPRSGWFSWWG